MPKYYVNKNTDTNPNNDHEVHEEGCHKMPSSVVDLGYHTNCDSALTAAKNIYSNSDGCRICSPSCHNS